MHIKSLVIFGVLATGLFAEASVCQVKPNGAINALTGDWRDINVWSLYMDNKEINKYTQNDIDLQAAIEERDNLIEKGDCEEARELPKCSTRIFQRKDNEGIKKVSYQVLVGDEVAASYGGRFSLEPYSITKGKETLAALKTAKICN